MPTIQGVPVVFPIIFVVVGILWLIARYLDNNPETRMKDILAAASQKMEVTLATEGYVNKPGERKLSNASVTIFYYRDLSSGEETLHAVLVPSRKVITVKFSADGEIIMIRGNFRGYGPRELTEELQSQVSILSAKVNYWIS